MSTHAPTQKTWMTWTGRVFSALVVLMLAFSAFMKLTQNPEAVKGFVEQFGYPVGILVTLGVVELACALLYLIPTTRVLGAILVTGYLGGAIATHVRVGEGFLPPLILGILAWGGLYLRDARLRNLLPLVGKSVDAP